jgi:hypothetical protein
MELRHVSALLEIIRYGTLILILNSFIGSVECDCSLDRPPGAQPYMYAVFAGVVSGNHIASVIDLELLKTTPMVEASVPSASMPSNDAWGPALSSYIG